MREVKWVEAFLNLIKTNTNGALFSAVTTKSVGVEGNVFDILTNVAISHP